MVLATRLGEISPIQSSLGCGERRPPQARSMIEFRSDPLVAWSLLTELSEHEAGSAWG